MEEIRQALAIAMLVSAGRVRSFILENLEEVGLKQQEGD
jgi:hypothetical protein